MTAEQLKLREKIVQTWPEELRAEKRWCAWFKGDPKPDGDGYAKVPRGSHSNPETWDTFEDIWTKLKPGDGVGYNFLHGDVHPWDLDHVRNASTGLICNEAMILLSRWQSFAEISISGRGLHVFTRGEVRGQQLTETCLQYWNPAKAPRFFTVTGELVGAAFNVIRDIGADGNYVFATAAHISAKMREELQAIDQRQWEKLPAEPVKKASHEPKEKQKTKTRKVVAGFDIKDFLQFYGLGIDNECDNEIGHCIRLTSCPVKGAKHVGQNSTTTNFVYPTKDGGIAFHCQSTGCVEYSASEVIKKLAEEQGPYGGKIYEKVEKEQSPAVVESVRSGKLVGAETISKKHRLWLWPGYLESNKLVHFAGASSEGKSPVTLDLTARVTAALKWPDEQPNSIGPRSVILMAGEDDWADTIIPRLELANANLSKVFQFVSTIKRGEEEHDVSTALDRDVELLTQQIEQQQDVGLIIIDPITNYLGNKSMNKEDEMRGGILMPLATLAQSHNVCVVTVGHLNKRDKDASLLQRLMGAAAFGGVARQVFIFGNDPEDDDKFSHVMGLARATKTPPLKYKTSAVQVEWDGKSSEVVKVDWHGPATVDMDEVINAPKSREKSLSKEAQAFIKAFLRDGAKSTQAVEAALKEAGIECANWQRAAKRVAKSRKIKGAKNAGWEWYLPAAEQDSIEFDTVPGDLLQ